MNNELTVTINKTQLPVKEYQGQRVVTMKEIDTVHQRPDGTARKRFNDNKKHFIEGVDFFTITQPSEIRTLGLERPQGGTPESVTLITESGYLMLVKSFTDDLAWTVQRQLVNTYFRVTNRSGMEVLPPDYPSALRALADSAEQLQALAAENERQKQEIADFEPMRQYIDTILESPGTMATTQIAADYDMSAKRLNRILHDAGIQRCVNGQWILYKAHMGKGYTKSKTFNFTHSDGRPDSKPQTQWTQKGRLLIHEILTERGFTAVMDRKNAS